MKTRKNDFLKNLGFPSPSGDVIEEDGSINEAIILNRLFIEIQGKKVEIGLNPANYDNVFKECSVIGVADCVAHIFGSYLELTDIEENEIFQKSGLMYHPKNSGLKRFGYCCAGFHERHDPAKDDLLVVSIKSILYVKHEGREIFLFKSYGDRFDLILNGESMFKGWEHRF
jgi:hypothetical protein